MHHLKDVGVVINSPNTPRSLFLPTHISVPSPFVGQVLKQYIGELIGVIADLHQSN